MIEEPPVLTIVNKPRRRRPTDAQIAPFADAPTGFVADAMDGRGALDFRIKGLPGLPARLVGPALTCDSGPSDILALLAALDEVQPGDVLVNAVGGWTGCAALGDRVCGMARNAGAAGLVTDGPARDLLGIQSIGLPVFCVGLCPNSPFGKGPGTVGMPIEIGGRHVETGDLVVADADGVVVVPFARIEEIGIRVSQVAQLEETLDAEVAHGLTCPHDIQTLLSSASVRRV